MIIDANVKLGPSFKRTSFLAEDYIKEMKANGIDKAVIMAEKPTSYDISEGNDYIEEVLTMCPELFYGAVRVDPWNEAKAMDELEQRFENSAFRAVYLNPWEENYQVNSDIVRPVLDFAAEKQINVIVEAGYVWVSHVSQIADIASQYPKVGFLMANAGQMDLSGYSLTDVKYFMKKTPNLYMGTDAAVAADWTVDLYRNVSPGKILFETNYPFFEVKLEKARVELGFFELEEKAEIYSANVKKFLRLNETK